MHLKPARTVARAATFGGILVLGLGTAQAAMAHQTDTVDVSCNANALGMDIGSAVNGEILDLATDCSYKLAAPLPNVTKNIIIEGNSATFKRTPLAEPFTILAVYPDTNVVIEDVNFSNGGAGEVWSGDGPGYGGAIHNGGKLSVIGGEFNKNSAGDGGAIANEGALSVTGAYFSENEAGDGGAIYNSGDLNVASSTFSGNDAAGDGGAIDNVADADDPITNSTFVSNTADLGGAVYNCGVMEVGGSTFTSNTAVEGGALYNSDELAVTDSTIEYNTASDKGGGIYSCDPEGLCLTGDTIRWNTPDQCYPNDYEGCGGV